MIVITKQVNAGKTQDAVIEALAAVNSGMSTLFVTCEATPENIAGRVAHECQISGVDLTQSAPMTIIHATTVTELKAKLFDFARKDAEFDVIVVDCNYAVSRPEWFNLLQQLENDGFEIVATQQVVRAPKAK